MIFHNCIGCDHFTMRPIAQNVPSWERIVCEECSEVQWLLHSRLNPTTYPERMVEVDEVNKTVRVKSDPEKARA